jgi:hypothetical protein
MYSYERYVEVSKNILENILSSAPYGNILAAYVAHSGSIY